MKQYVSAFVQHAYESSRSRRAFVRPEGAVHLVSPYDAMWSADREKWRAVCGTGGWRDEGGFLLTDAPVDCGRCLSMGVDEEADDAR